MQSETPMRKSGSAYLITERNRIRRMHERGSYDHKAVHTVLDAAMLCHIAYLVDEQLYCTPTLFWREGTHLYWHGSSASRMLRSQAGGLPVCVTVTHLDGLILARSGFNHSVNYRSAMCFGMARIVDDAEMKQRAVQAMVDRFYPGRTKLLRPVTARELKATTFMSMEIEQASVKIRAKGVADEKGDYALPIWAAVIPVRSVLGADERCPCVPPSVERPRGLDGFAPGRLLDVAVSEAYEAWTG